MSRRSMVIYGSIGGEDLGFIEWVWWHEDQIQVFRVTRAAGLGDDQVHMQCQQDIDVTVMHIEHAHASIEVSSKSLMNKFV